MRFLVTIAALSAAACSPVPTRDGWLPVHNGFLYYRTVGRGPDTVVVLHGGPGLHHGYLVDALEPLARSRALVFYDQRGRGRSRPAGDTATLSLSQDVADLEALRERLGLREMELLGHGWGAGLAVAYAREHPGRVSRMVMLSPMFPRVLHNWGVLKFPYEGRDSLALRGIDSARITHLDSREPHAFCRRYWGAWLSPAAVRDHVTMRALGRGMCQADSAALAQVEAVNRGVLRSLGMWDWRDSLANVGAPVLLVQGNGLDGRSDSTTSVVWRQSAREWTEALHNSGVVFVDGPAQFPWVRSGAEVRRIVDMFLRGEWPRDAVASRNRQ